MLKVMNLNLLKFDAGSQGKSLRWLEPYDGKLSRTVPRGGR